MKPTFKTYSDGRKIWVSGHVIIEKVLHRVSAGYVACSHSLNHRAWNTTEQETKCLECFPHARGEQLKLFD